QRREARQEPLEQRIRGARARRPLVDRAIAADRGPGGEASGFHLALRSLRRGAGDRLAVALQAVDLALGRRLDVGRQRRVLELRRALLARAVAVGQPVLDELGLRRVLTGLAGVLPREEERDRGDRVRLRVLRVDRAEAQVGGRRQALAGGRGGLER